MHSSSVANKLPDGAFDQIKRDQYIDLLDVDPDVDMESEPTDTNDHTAVIGEGYEAIQPDDFSLELNVANTTAPYDPARYDPLVKSTWPDIMPGSLTPVCRFVCGID